MRALVTGGAGFIGSTIVDALLAAGHQVRVLDDLCTGFRDNVSSEADLVIGGVADHDAVRAAMDGIEVVFHQAAHRAVQRSVVDPVATDLANTHGTVTVLKAAADAGVRRMVYASSSSVYGNATDRPTAETARPQPRSPYAVSKLAGELYCRSFAELFDIETVSLRYFNVYGPRQRPDSAYAAVIPLFIDAVRGGERPIVHGDGQQTRSFTYVGDVARANLLAAEAPAQAAAGSVYNIAGDQPYSILDILDVVKASLGSDLDPVHTDPRAGDVRHTWGDPSAAAANLGFTTEVALPDGMARTVEWFMRRSAAG